MPEWVKWALAPLAVAVIAAVISITPAIYDRVTAPTPKLEWSRNIGPTIDDNGIRSQIVVFTIYNNGTKPLNQIQFIIRVSNGEVVAYNISERFRYKPTVENSSNQISVRLQTLHPKEQVSLSTMLRSNVSISNVDIDLRSAEVVGSEVLPENIIRGERRGMSDVVLWITAGSSLIAAYIVMGFILIRSRGAAAFIQAGLFYGSLKREFFYYVARMFGLNECASVVEHRSHLTYREFSDLVYLEARNDPEKKNAAIRALG